MGSQSENALQIPEEERELYLLAKIVAERSQGREVVIWGAAKAHSEIARLEETLQKRFSKSASFHVSLRQDLIDNAHTFPFDRLKGNRSQYYVVSYAEENDRNVEKMARLGYRKEEDFIFRFPKPVVLTNFDLSAERYEDERGNVAEGEYGKVGKIIFRGGNNRIVLYGKNQGADKLLFDMSSNGLAEIGKSEGGCVFGVQVRITISRSAFPYGAFKLTLGHHCRFTTAWLRCFSAYRPSSCQIGAHSTFWDNFHAEVNSGKRLIIGQDCMFSRNCSIFCGDGHSIFDVNTGANLNSKHETQSERQNQLILGDHVWVGAGAAIMHGSNIGSGSIIGAQSAVKGVFPNNCTIRGNPASIGRKNVAWCRMNMEEDPSAVPPEYYRKTEDV